MKSTRNSAIRNRKIATKARRHKGTRRSLCEPSCFRAFVAKDFNDSKLLFLNDCKTGFKSASFCVRTVPDEDSEFARLDHEFHIPVVEAQVCWREHEFDAALFARL